MYLFFNGVSSQGYIALFSENREIIASNHFEISRNESTQTIPVIDEFMDKQNITYGDITNIVTVVGPGSFTGIRTISLVVNTLAYIYPHISLTPVNFFDLYNAYPVVKSSSKRDLFVKHSKSATIEIVQNRDFEESYTGETVFGDTNIDRFEREYILNNSIDYVKIIQNIALQENQRVAPLYIKKPTIS